METFRLSRIGLLGPCLIVAALLAAGAAGMAPAGAALGTTTPAKCSSFGPTWSHAYNLRAQKDGNPVRILSACCTPTAKFGVNACLVTVTLAGTTDRGCESVDISAKGSVVGAGRHLNCSPQE